VHRERVGLGHVALGLIVGYGVNVLLPARLGEFFRVDYVARLANISRATVLGSVILERLLDLTAILTIFGLGITVANSDNPQIIRVIYIAWGSVIFGVAAVGAILIVRPMGLQNIDSAAARVFGVGMGLRISLAISKIGDLFGIIATRKFFLIVGMTWLIYALEAAAISMVCKSIGQNLTSAELMMLLGAATLSTLFPTAPGFVGSYQFAFVLVLRNFDVSDDVAVVAATGVQLYLIGLYSVIGLIAWAFVALWRAWSDKFSMVPETK
jgi:glycosyltransferase 2 family protein